MSEAGVVVVGGGQAGFSVVDELRRNGYEGRVRLVDQGTSLPYQRPPLSKAYLAGDLSNDALAFRPAGYYDDLRIELLLGERLVGIDTHRMTATLSGGHSIAYGELVIATGSTPRPCLINGSELAGVFRLHGRGQAHALRTALSTARALAVVGGGFIGLELAAAARKRNVAVTVIEVAPRLMQRSLSAQASQLVTDLHLANSVSVRCGVGVSRVVAGPDGAAAAVQLDNGEHVAADLVVIGIGSIPAMDGHHLGVDADPSGAIHVDQLMRTSLPHVYACGDGTAFLREGHRIRLESVQNATDQGRCVASSILGAPRPYDSVPWFWTEQYGTKLQIAGLLTDANQWATRVDSRGGVSVFGFRDHEFLGSEAFGSVATHLATRSLLRAKYPLLPAQASDPDFDLRAAANTTRAAVA